MNGIYPDLFDDREAKLLREMLERDGDANGTDPIRRGALKAAASEHRRATSHREQLTRLEEGLRKDVVELPFVFRPQLDMGAVEMRGELWAMMLDAKRTVDELVERHAPDEETRDRILRNRIYQEISNAMAGSQEYMAMEKLYELHQEARYDLLVLDTPPTRH